MRPSKRPSGKQAPSEKQSPRTESNATRTGHSLSEGLFFVLAGLVLFFFLVRPCFSTDDSPIRFVYMLLPILEPNAIFEHFWGSDLVPFSFATLGLALWQRVQTLFLAVVCLTAANGLGLLLRQLEPDRAKRNDKSDV
ncbi:MAG: hypothetical protein Q4G59_11375, partial [Planctomycetia bacterium]|nr:hypothetical protein [Planctomycetia bacterium]